MKKSILLKLFRMEKILTLKNKLILGFTLIIFITSAVSIISYFTLRSSISKMDNMIETTILANNIMDYTHEIDTLLRDFLVDRKAESKEKILLGIKNITNNVNKLGAFVVDKSGVPKLESISRLFETYNEYVQDVLNEKNLSKAIEIKGNIVKVKDFLNNSILELISAELTNQSKVKSELMKITDSTGLVIIILIVLIAAVSIAASCIYAGKVGGMINKLAVASQNIADGNLQAEKLQSRSNDDISLLVQSFNKMLDNLRSLITAINDTSINVAHSADSLKAGTEQSAKAIEQVSSTIQQVATGAITQSDKIKQTVEVVNMLTSRNKRIFASSKNVQSASEKASNAARQGNQKMSTLLAQISVIQDKIVNTQSTTELLKAKSGQIQKILESITNIASQTNLLALNAAIEAARAGEHGKGFAVVADEIKKLSEGSAKAAKEITIILKEIQNQSQLVAESMTAGVAEVSEGSGLANEALKVFNDIVSTSQNVDSQIRLITEEISNTVKEIDDVGEMSRSISRIAEESLYGTQEAAAAIEEETASQEEIASSAIMLAEMADKLQKMLLQFKM